jgi:single-strand DNA-binding protein
MRGINKVILVGNLGKDPDLQHLEGNIPVAKFPLATSEIRKDKKGETISETEWHSIVLWRGLADLAGKYLHKSSLVYIEGKLHSRNWEDKNGFHHCQTEVVADKMVMLEKKKGGPEHSEAEVQPCVKLPVGELNKDTEDEMEF